MEGRTTLANYLSVRPSRRGFNVKGIYGAIIAVTKNRCVTHVKIRGYANLVSSLLAYLISAVASWFSNSILSRSRMLLQIACYCNVTLFSIAGKF